MNRVERSVGNRVLEGLHSGVLELRPRKTPEEIATEDSTKSTEDVWNPITGLPYTYKELNELLEGGVKK